MKFDFAAPHPALDHYVASYYVVGFDETHVEGIDRPSVGQIRILLEGRGAFDYSGGTAPLHDVTLMGPGSEAAPYRLEGPLTCFGVALRPLGWGAIVGEPATNYADRFGDGTALWGARARTLHGALRSAGTIGEMGRIADAFLLGVLRAPPEGHAELCAAVRRWIANDRDGALDLEPFFASLPMSERHAARLVRHYYGGPPKRIARKYRALKAAALLLKGGDPDEVAHPFYDQSHMISEIRHFTGHTPGRLATDIDAVLAVTLLGDDFAKGDEAGTATVAAHEAVVRNILGRTG